MNRRNALTLGIKAAMAAGLTGSIPVALLRSHSAHADILSAGLSDPNAQQLFENPTPNALAASFKLGYQSKSSLERRSKRSYVVSMRQTKQYTGLVNSRGRYLKTPCWGYAEKGRKPSWPGRTIELHTSDDPIQIKWKNGLVKNGKPRPHLLPIDSSLHWAYALHGYEQYSIENDGVPVVPHLHGGHNHYHSDGNPEFFFSPKYKVRGPRWESKKYEYGGDGWNDAAGMNWYHDHALGITRQNVYAGLAGMCVVRDDDDTGRADNRLDLPADPYELGFVIQDRMFENTGELFLSAFPGEPGYSDFITDQGVTLPTDKFPNGGPTVLAEFFGDHITVNGVLWPKYDVEGRQYRIRLLNGSDSRFLRLRMVVVPAGETDPAAGSPLPFTIIGSDQSLLKRSINDTEIDCVPSGRVDLVFDFKKVKQGDRVILENLLGDAPFTGELPTSDDLFPNRRTNRIMAFDVVKPLSDRREKSIGNHCWLSRGVSTPKATNVRKLGIYEGMDEFGRLQPMVGTAEQVTNVEGETVNGSMPWHAPISENPDTGSTEIWELYNVTEDAHPIHVHGVFFEIINREPFSADVIEQPVVQHDGATGVGGRIENIALFGEARGPENSEKTRRDMVTAFPGEVTRIRMTFPRPGRYTWHCHILSHEDHDMMRPFHVGPGPY